MLLCTPREGVGQGVGTRRVGKANVTALDQTSCLRANGTANNAEGTKAVVGALDAKGHPVIARGAEQLLQLEEGPLCVRDETRVKQVVHE